MQTRPPRCDGRAGGRVAWCVALLLLAAAPGAEATEPTLIAVAANFGETAEHLSSLYTERSGRHLALALGSTGSLAAQIETGAPFAALLAADVRTPEHLEADGRAVPGTRFVYAVGQLALWSADARRIGADGVAALRDPTTRHVAIANPDLAPYGAAARQALQRLGLWEGLGDRLVTGQNVGHTLSLVASGAAEVGFVSVSALSTPDRPETGSRWNVPPALYDPIRQAAVLLVAGRDDDDARGFLAFLRTEEARDVIRRFGYGVE